ncbi:MAG: hypothetical protein ACRDJC_14705 [Thermomicrobiales bacterium]
MYLFLSGAEMQPERVRADWPEARFVARGRLEPRPLGAVMPPASPRYETWGIVIETSAAPAAGETRDALTDDGRAFAVVVPAADDADPAAVLAAARYWELPPLYVRRLARAANAPVEEYVY